LHGLVASTLPAILASHLGWASALIDLAIGIRIMIIEDTLCTCSSLRGLCVANTATPRALCPVYTARYFRCDHGEGTRSMFVLGAPPTGWDHPRKHPTRVDVAPLSVKAGRAGGLEPSSPRSAWGERPPAREEAVPIGTVARATKEGEGE
jgi:hypothetical protein